MDIKTIQDEITKLEREKAQLELRDEQIKAEKTKIVAALKERGLTEKDLDGEISRLTAEIQAELTKLGIKFESDNATVAVAAGVSSFDDL